MTAAAQATPNVTAASIVLDFNSHKIKEAAASDAINEVINAGLTTKRDKQERRAYLGASAVGGSCERAMQFEFAGAARENDFSPKTLRKFDLGHMGEEMARAWFQDAGFDLVQKNQRTGQIFGFSQMEGRFKGHPDGVFIGGPDLAAQGVGYPCLWEHKFVGSKSYNEIVKHGLKKAKPTYYAQVAIYQAYLGLTDHPAIFTVTTGGDSKTDMGQQTHILIPFDAEEAQRMSDRAVRIIKATDAGELLPRPFAPDHFECRWCAFAERCGRVG